MTPLEIENALILEAIECYEEVFHDCTMLEPEEATKFAAKYGIPAEIGLHVLRSLIREYRMGTLETVPRTRILDTLKANITGMVQRELRALLPAPPTVATETLSVEDTRKRTITRARKVDQPALPPAEYFRCRHCDSFFDDENVKTRHEVKCLNRPREALPPNAYSARKGIPGPKPKPHVPMIDDLPEEEQEEAYGPSYHELTIQVLKDTGRPMRAKEIEDIIMQQNPRLEPSNSTIAVALSKDAAREHGQIYRVSTGLYALRGAAQKVEPEDEDGSPEETDEDDDLSGIELADPPEETESTPTGKHFYSTENAAKEVGVSLRHFSRIAEEEGLEPLVFGEGTRGEKHMWTAEQLQALKAARNGSTDEAPSDPGYVYSRPFRCPKCGAGMARLRRKSDADRLRDFWIHPGPNCEIKIAHYQIKDDPKYQPAATA